MNHLQNSNNNHIELHQTTIAIANTTFNHHDPIPAVPQPLGRKNSGMENSLPLNKIIDKRNHHNST
eukprot:UN33073